MTRITKPKPGFWLRVVPSGKSAPAVVSPRLAGEADPSNMFWCFGFGAEAHRYLKESDR